jgi:cobyrinic acid a,c-diamide synthase
MTKAVLIAGTHSGVGKTTVAAGVAAALAKRGLKVQTFKVGPDYLDPGYLAAAAGRPCLNLDLWLLPKRGVMDTYARAAADADVCVIEGMMGLYDGMGMKGTAVSTADVDGLIEAPVILVVDGSAMVESAAAVVQGFAAFGEMSLPGVIFNRVGERHFATLKRAVEVAGDVKAVGHLPPESDLAIPERHLGLVTLDPAKAKELLPKLAETVERCVNLDDVLEIAGEAAEHKAPAPKAKGGKSRARIAIARDEAFHFYYEDGLAGLKAAGAELVPFSPLKDDELPFATSAVYLGGGFPEIHAQRLDENTRMRDTIRKAIDQGMPVYAECGGLMYLATHLVGSGVRAWDMVGALPGEITMGGLTSFGYATATALRDTFLVREGEKLRGHEFHYSAWSGEGGGQSVYSVSRPGRDDGRKEGFGRENLHATYVHVHFGSQPELARRFVDAAEAFAKSGRKKKVKSKA